MTISELEEIRKHHKETLSRFKDHLAGEMAPVLKNSIDLIPVLLSEVDRLRETLKLIAKEPTNPSLWTSMPQRYFVTIARKALGEEQ